MAKFIENYRRIMGEGEFGLRGQGSKREQEVMQQAISITKARCVARLTDLAITNSPEVRRQIAEAKKTLDSEIAKVERRIREIEEKEKTQPELEKPRTVGRDLMTAYRREEERLEQERVDAINKPILERDKREKEELAIEKKMLEGRVKRLREISDAFKRDLPDFLKSLCKPEEISQRLLTSIAKGMMDGQMRVESVGRKKGF